jgi:hypothetical protein
MIDANDEKPPVFSRWNGWYWLVMTFLLIQIMIYYFITSSFS